MCRGQGLSSWLCLSSVRCRGTKPGGPLIRTAYCINSTQHNTGLELLQNNPPHLCLLAERKLGRQMFGNVWTPFRWRRPTLTLDDTGPSLQWQNAASSEPADFYTHPCRLQITSYWAVLSLHLLGSIKTQRCVFTWGSSSPVTSIDWFWSQHKGIICNVPAVWYPVK